MDLPGTKKTIENLVKQVSRSPFVLLRNDVAYMKLSLLILGAIPGQLDEMRGLALNGLLLLSNREDNKVPMYGNADVREVLLAGAAAGQPEEVRTRALVTLQTLASAPANKVPMWENDSVRAALLAGAAAGQPEEVRTLALATLDLACAPANKVPMWENDSVGRPCWLEQQPGSLRKCGHRH